MSNLSLITGPVPVIAVLLGVLGLGWLVIGDFRYVSRVVPAAVGIALVVTLLIAYLAENVFHWWDGGLPRVLYVPAGLVILAVVLLLPRMGVLQSFAGKLAAVLAVVLVLIGAASIVNVHFGQYPTLASALGQTGVSAGPIEEIAAGPGTPGEPPVTEATWVPPSGMPSNGNIYSVTIPAPASGYTSGPALVYVPPAYLASPKAVNLPVLVLFHGMPGSPVDWLTGGQLAAVMDAYAAAHEGLAPVVVLPDITNNGAADPPLCMDTTISRSATYLAVDVPAWVKTTLGAGTSSAQQWAVAGFSYGGTCTMQLAANFPEIYPTFIDIAGETEPTVPGGREALVSTYFAGDAAAFTAQNAIDRLAVRSYGSSTGIIVTGAGDSVYGPQGKKVYDAALAAGMNVTLQELPGGHSWQVWKPGLQNNLDWLTGQLGLTAP
ncbi:S-formylglutathione hydrolase FrmB [Arthrobacter sp. CAN_A6]|uniref:alpha/beta hydrolase n=1 Tax=Arthrobacter sp. CAN_A6 TaxID=2787721 RepID=UPI0018CA435A